MNKRAKNQLQEAKVIHAEIKTLSNHFGQKVKYFY
jgi:hypothetical protein